MSIAIQSVQTATSSTGTLDIAKPTGLAADDLLVACVGRLTATGDNLPDTPTGWTSIDTQTVRGNPGMRSMYKIADSSDASATEFTFTGGTDNLAGTLYRITGHSAELVVDDKFSGEAQILSYSFTVSGSITPIVEDGLLIASLLSHDVETDFTNFSITGGTNPTWTTRQEADNPSSVGQRWEVIDGSYGVTTEITAFSADISDPTGPNDAGVIIMYLPPATDVSGTSTLLVNANSVITSPSAVEVGGNGTATLVKNDSEIVFSPVQAKGEQPTVWSNKSKSSTDWTNQNKS